MKKLFIALCLSLSSIALYANEQDTVNFYIQNYQYQKALEYINTKTETKSLLKQKAQCYKLLGDYRHSIEILSSLTEQFADDIHIKNELASCYQYTGNWEGAIECYDDLIQTDSTNLYYQIQKADMLYHKEDYAKALSSYKNILENNNNTTILKQAGRCFESMNLIDSAQMYYKKAWDINPKDGSAAANYINTTIKLKDYLTAGNACMNYIERDSTNKQINRLYAFTYYIMDLYEPAAELFEKCIANGDSSLMVNRSLGISYYSLKDPRAYEYLKKAYVQDTINNNVIYCLGVVCNDLSKEEEAVIYFTKLLERVVPKSGALYLNYRGLAIAYDNLHKYKEALENYNNALKYGTESQKAYILAIIAGIYNNNLKDRKMAIKYYKEYRDALTIYLEGIKAKEDTDPLDVEETETKLKELKKYIKELEM
jgi:tetratricopeptide (TPR) repeat protein